MSFPSRTSTQRAATPIPYASRHSRLYLSRTATEDCSRESPVDLASRASPLHFVSLEIDASDPPLRITEKKSLSGDDLPEKHSFQINHSDLESNPPLPPLNVAPDIPDGGAKAWMTILGAWLVLFCTFGMTSAYGIFQDHYTRVFLKSSSPSDISWIGSTQLFLVFALGIPIGRAFDDGYFHFIMILGTVVYSLSIFMLSVTQPDQYFQVLLSQGILSGIGVGMMFLPSYGIVSHHFRNRRALAMGIVGSGSSCGALVFGFLNQLFDAIGFAWGVRAAGFLILGLLILANFLMSTRLPPKPRSNGPLFNTSIFRDIPYMISVFGVALVFMGLFFPIFYLQLFAIGRGIEPRSAFYLISILNAASIVGRIVPNFLADKLGAFNMLIPFTTLASILTFTLLGVQCEFGFIVFAIIFGFASGAFMSLCTPLWAYLSPSVSEIGIRLGLAFSVVSLFALIGTPIAGALLTEELLWYRPVVFSGMVIFVGTALIVITRHLVSIKKGTQLL